MGGALLRTQEPRLPIGTRCRFPWPSCLCQTQSCHVATVSPVRRWIVQKCKYTLPISFVTAIKLLSALISRSIISTIIINMPSPSIHTFNPFNLQQGSNQGVHAKVQEVIYYGESRCRQALADMSKADSRHQDWMQRSLQKELVCILSFELSHLNLVLVVSHVICGNCNLSRPGHRSADCSAVVGCILRSGARARSADFIRFGTHCDAGMWDYPRTIRQSREILCTRLVETKKRTCRRCNS